MNRFFKILIFLMYSWLIYISFLIFATPLVASSFIDSFPDLVLSILFVLGLLFMLVFSFFYNFTTFLGNPFMPLIINLFIINLIPFIYGWKKQTILRACALAFAGLMVDPGVLTFGVMDGHTGLMYLIIIFICLNTFYPLLDYGNKYQKKRWPHN